jgi:hypothetical protein
MESTILYSLPETVLNAVLGYLGTKPYLEVLQLVEAMQKNAVKLPPAAADEE